MAVPSTGRRLLVSEMELGTFELLRDVKQPSLESYQTVEQSRIDRPFNMLHFSRSPLKLVLCSTGLPVRHSAPQSRY